MSPEGASLDLKKMAADTGCHVHPDCLTCPLEACIYDHSERGPRSVRPVNVEAARRAHQLRDEGWARDAVAKELGVSQRTVSRWWRLPV